jgi:deoxyribonuclease-4
MLKIGSHVQFKSPDYLVGAIEQSIRNKATTAMIYLGAPQNSKRVSTDKYQLDFYLEKYADIIKPEDIIVHAPYITNPANLEKFAFANDFLIAEIARMNYIGAKYLVLHPGAHTKYKRENSLKQLVKSLKYILAKTKDVEILIETMSGKGTEIGTTFSELDYIIKNVNSSRVGICLDTCHV